MQVKVKPDKKVAEQRELNCVWMRPVTNIKSGKDYMLYRSSLASSTLIVLFSEMLEFSKEIKFERTNYEGK
jgi:hypothetical protein